MFLIFFKTFSCAVCGPLPPTHTQKKKHLGHGPTMFEMSDPFRLHLLPYTQFEAHPGRQLAVMFVPSAMFDSEVDANAAFATGVKMHAAVTERKVRYCIQVLFLHMQLSTIVKQQHRVVRKWGVRRQSDLCTLTSFGNTVWANRT